jgi:hypothetical protein
MTGVKPVSIAEGLDNNHPGNKYKCVSEVKIRLSGMVILKAGRIQDKAL